jgi:hypothetical protein
MRVSACIILDTTQRVLIEIYVWGEEEFEFGSYGQI